MADVAVHTSITDRVAVLTLSHPARRNALNIALSALLAEAVQAAADDPGVGAIVVTGEDPAFCAGGDLAELATAGPAQLKTVYAGFLALADCPLPTIAAVNGAAVGAGLNLALATDLRLAGPRASFDSRFLQLGLHPGGGYTWMAQRVLGPQGAAAMTLFGEAVDAAEAERIGLVHRVVDDVVGAAVDDGGAGRGGEPGPDRRDEGHDAPHRGHGGAGRGRRGRGAGAGRVGAIGRVQVAAGGAAGPDQPSHGKPDVSESGTPDLCGRAGRNDTRSVRELTSQESTCTRPEE